MKIKMIKMGSDINPNMNVRIRGIIETRDKKHLFVEIQEAHRFERIYTSLTQEEYDEKYPNASYIHIGDCFRVDVPKDYMNNSTKEFQNYIHKAFYKIEYTKEGIIKVLQMLNPDISDLELTDEYYIDKYCEERGFFALFDERLKHTYTLQDIELYGVYAEKAVVNLLYTCYSSTGTKYEESIKVKRDVYQLMQEFGKDKVIEQLIDYKTMKIFTKDATEIDKRVTEIKDRLNKGYEQRYGISKELYEIDI